MNILISGSCDINAFAKIQIKNRLKYVMEIMDAIREITIYIREDEEKFQATIKASVQLKKKVKTIKVKGKGSDIIEAVDKSIIKLSNRFFKRMIKYRRKDQTLNSRAA